MKKSVFPLVVLFMSIFAAHSQYVIKSPADLVNLKGVPQEKVYINHTGPVVFSGEYLYYAFQCFNAQNSRPSSVSKVGYVALVNTDGEYVLEQKIKLVRGLGQGDFFVSTEVASGNYKLLGYTQWMKNNGLSQVFQDNLVIINPYSADQSALLGNGEEGSPKPQTLAAIPMDSATVGLQLNKTHFSKREQVSLSLNNYKGYLGNGTYGIKVVRENNIEVPPAMSAMKFGQDYMNVAKEIYLKVGDSLYLPEQRGELLFGTVTDETTKAPVANVPVVVSLPGKEFVLKFATTDEEGNFYTYLRKDYKERVAVIQIEDDSRDVAINVKTPSKLPTDGLTYGTFTFDKALADIIKQRSVHNQVENQFFALKPDSVLLGDPIDPFDGGIPEVVQLDDYTRFPTFQETLIEILSNAGYRNNGKDNDYIRIAQDFETFNEDFNSLPAIVLFDGVYIANHEAMKTYDARKIKSISLIRDKFQLANKEYQGIMAVETFDGNYMEEFQGVNGAQLPIVKPEAKKNYYVQTYNDGSFNRIPDYRNLLFWQPNIVLEGSGADFQFYTSDLSGTFKIIVDGFTTYGKPISFEQTITVE